jgi:3-hydroxyisobutyrate dehydrogenase-like beta-hydroxyacid dehydrogenase
VERIGFIGIGIMGKPMAGRLLEAGYQLAVLDRSPDCTADLVGRGAHDVWRFDGERCARVVAHVMAAVDAG